MVKQFFKKIDNDLTAFQKVVLCELACTYGSFLNRRSELNKMNKCDPDINQRYYESYCALLGATKVLGLRFIIDYNSRIIYFVKVDSDIEVLNVPISNLVYERFEENEVIDKKIKIKEIAKERKSKNTEVED